MPCQSRFKRIIHFLSLRKEPQEKQTSSGAQGWVRFDNTVSVSVRMLQKFFNGKAETAKAQSCASLLFSFLVHFEVTWHCNTHGRNAGKSCIPVQVNCTAIIYHSLNQVIIKSTSNLKMKCSVLGLLALVQIRTHPMKSSKSARKL